MNPRRRRVQWRFSAQRRRERLLSAGLTTAGTPRRYRQFPQLANLTGPRRFKAYRKLLRAELRAQGLTEKGKVRRDAPAPLMRAYLEFRATIQMPELNFTTGRCE